MILLLVQVALARPTEGNTDFSFSDADTVVSYDSPTGAVRVWYSVDGPNVVALEDDDGDGLPDFVTTVATTAEDVLDFYAAEGFRPPLSDGDKGGNDAMDVYLVDFGGNADGHYTAESCGGNPRVCSGYFEMENDFAGYGYSDLPTAIKVLTSHELFHAVQAAYSATSDAWFAEGSAVWGEWAFDEGSEDFLWFAGQYLDDTGRSLDEPPAGPIPVFDYATALWWYFLANRYGDSFIEGLLQDTETNTGDDFLLAMSAREEAAGGSLRDDWITFANWNLATATLAGATESYPFASRIGPIDPEVQGDAIVDDNRYYPLAASYYKLSHPGGELQFALATDAPELSFTLHPTDDDGDVLDALDQWDGAAAPRSLGDLPAGTYWLVGTNATLATQSTKVVTCLGDAATVAECAASGDTGETGDTGDGAGESPGGGCGCATGGAGARELGGEAAAGLLAFAAVIRRRRRGV